MTNKFRKIALAGLVALALTGCSTPKERKWDEIQKECSVTASYIGRNPSFDYYNAAIKARTFSSANGYLCVAGELAVADSSVSLDSLNSIGKKIHLVRAASMLWDRFRKIDKRKFSEEIISGLNDYKETVKDIPKDIRQAFRDSRAFNRAADGLNYYELTRFDNVLPIRCDPRIYSLIRELFEEDYIKEKIPMCASK